MNLKKLNFLSVKTRRKIAAGTLSIALGLSFVSGSVSSIALADENGINISNFVIKAFADEMNQRGVKKIVSFNDSGDGTFIIKNNGSVYAFGRNYQGSLGVGDTSSITIPTKIDIDNVQDIVSTGYSTFFIKSDGTVYACGENSYGNLGLGNTERITVPTKINIDNVKKVIADRDSTFFIKDDGDVYACGENEYGQLGLNNTIIKLVPTKVMIDNVKDISISYKYSSSTFFIKNDETVYACGENKYGQLGLGDRTNRSVPTQINIDDVKSVINDVYANGTDCNCVLFLKTDGTVFFTGAAYTPSNFGLSRGYYNLPTQINIDDVSDVFVCNASLSEQHKGYLFIKNDGTLWGYGGNSYGQLGLGDITNRDDFEKIDMPGKVKNIFAFGNSIFAIIDDGSVYAWGRNINSNLTGDKNFGSKLGIGDSSYYKCVPTKVAMDNISDIQSSSYDNGSFFLKNDGTVWVTGDNYLSSSSYGYLGLGDREEGVLTPIELTGSFSDITAPSLTVIGNQTNWTNEEVTLTVTASDETGGSGIASITMPDSSTVTAGSGTYKVTKNGTYIFKATDKAGNVTTKEVTVSNIDTTAPTAPIISNNNGTITITAGTDSESGVKDTDYSIDGGAYQRYTIAFILDSGSHIVKAKTVDNAGNISNEATVNVTVDNQDMKNAQDAVDKAGQTLDQDDLDKAKKIVDGLPDGKDKDNLGAQIGDIQNKIDNKVADKALEAAEAAVVKAEKSLKQSDVDSARALVDKLSSGKDKTDLGNRLDAIVLNNTISAIDKDITSLEKDVNNHIAYNINMDIDSYKEKVSALQSRVDALPDSVSNTKTSFSNRLNEIENKLKNEQTIQNAIKKVENALDKAGKTLDKGDIDDAQKAIDDLPSSIDKTKYNNELRTIKQELQAQTAKDVTSANAAVMKVSRTKSLDDLNTARSLVDKLPDSSQKTQLTNQLNIIARFCK